MYKRQTLGRLAADIAVLLTGKHKVDYTKHVDCGDHVIVVNAEKIKMTGNKWNDKIYYTHSGYAGGLKEVKYSTLLVKKPELIIKPVSYTHLDVYKRQPSPRSAFSSKKTPDAHQRSFLMFLPASHGSHPR